MEVPGNDLMARVREIVDLINRGEFDEAATHAHPDIVLARAGGLPPTIGIEAFRAWMEPDAFESQTYAVLEAEVIDHCVLARARTVARGAGSGIEIEVVTWGVWTFDEDGLVTRFEYFLEHDQAAAREAAGLTD